MNNKQSRETFGHDCMIYIAGQHNILPHQSSHWIDVDDFRMISPENVRSRSAVITEPITVLGNIFLSAASVENLREWSRMKSNRNKKSRQKSPIQGKPSLSYSWFIAIREITLSCDTVLLGCCTGILIELWSPAMGRQSLRSASRGDPSFRNSNSGHSLFGASDPQLWNSLSLDIGQSRDSHNSILFKKKIKTFLFQQFWALRRSLNIL